MITVLLVAALCLFVLLFSSLLKKYKHLHIHCTLLEKRLTAMRASLADAKLQLRVQGEYDAIDPYDYERVYQQRNTRANLRVMKPSTDPNTCS